MFGGRGMVTVRSVKYFLSPPAAIHLWKFVGNSTVKAGTIPVEPYIFNNVPLDSMLTAIGSETLF